MRTLGSPHYSRDISDEGLAAVQLPMPPRSVQEFMLQAGAVLVILYVTWVFMVWLLGAAARRRYTRLKRDCIMDVDKYVGDPSPNGRSCVKVVMMDRMNLGSRVPTAEAVELGEAPSPFERNLLVTARLNPGSGVPLQMSGAQSIVVGTIRMGFGHHRIAYATTSWGLASGCKTYFHDFLGIESAEARLIEDIDTNYSKWSRRASEMGGSVERLWGACTKSGDENMLRATFLLAEHLKPLVLGLPKDVCLITSHSMVGAAAVACGFKRVINLVIDNHAQWFCIVPGALNLVQGASNFHSYLKMGVPANELRLAGHWIPKDLVDNIQNDSGSRKERLQKQGLPRRLLIPVGGAGAQRKFVTAFIGALGPAVKAGKVQLFLNAGDHAQMKDAFTQTLTKIGISFDTVDNLEGVRTFCQLLQSGAQPCAAVTLFAFKDYYPAVGTTDLLSRVSDVLCCKPSELAFYPIPKLMIRRVGDHEAYSALRASELGDGTLEVRELQEALQYVELFERQEPLNTMNDCIMRNATIGIYDGCKNAVEIATQYQLE